MPAFNRLLKFVILAAVLMLAVKLGAVWHDAGVAFAQGAKPEGIKSDGTKTADAAKPAEGAKPADNAAPDPLKTASTDKKYSPTELELLQNLSKRRGELDQRSEEMDRRELLLKATEQRVQEKIDQLQKMQAQLDAALGKVDEQEDQRLQSLVRIYEAMKPQEAAAIFDKLEQPVLLQVLTRMKDKSVAAILPHLDGDRARSITMALAEHKQLPDQKTN